jgi:hypothetical protein
MRKTGLCLLLWGLACGWTATDAPGGDGGEDAPAGADAVCWPDEAARQAIRNRTLSLKVLSASRRIKTFQAVRLVISFRNTGDRALQVPNAYPAMLGAEIAPAADGAQPMVYVPEVNARQRSKLVRIPAGRVFGNLHTANWLACRPLKGRPAEWPYLPPGTYRFRLFLCGAPDLRTDWMPLEVIAPRLSKAAEAAVGRRRPGGRLILLDADRCCPVPSGSVEAPFSHLRDALRSAKCGDVVFCEPGRYVTDSLTVPDGVLLAGAGAANSLLVVHTFGKSVPAVRLDGNCHVEDLAITNGDATASHLVLAEGKASRPTLTRCALFPGKDRVLGSLVAWRGAAPTARNCIVISPQGGYGVFARHRARPVLEYCTIVSRGFGVGMMDGSTPVIRRCIIAGRCPGVLTDTTCEVALADSVLWCRGGGKQFPYPVTKWRLEKDPEDPARTKTVSQLLSAVMKRRDVHCLDPAFVVRGEFGEYLTVPDGSDAAAYGAYAGKGGKWPASTAKVRAFPLPDLVGLLKTGSRQSASRRGG